MVVEISYLDVEISVKGVYTPGENEIMYNSDMSGYPGSSPEFEIYNIFIGGVPCFEIFQNYQLEDIQELVIEKIEER